MSPELQSVLGQLRQRRGIDLSGYRPGMLERRLCSRMSHVRASTGDEYLRLLERDAAEYDRLIESFSINVSAFFRDPIVWELLAQSVLPQLIATKRRSRTREIRVWSAGCAGGEEPYSIAILLHKALREELADWRVHIFATDLSEQTLKSAAHGIYPREQLEQTRLGIVDRYFAPAGANYVIHPFIRRMVWFSRDDLTSDERFAPAESVFGTFDLVLCRNVLIYFGADLQSRVTDKLTRSLAAGGILVIGTSEALVEGREQQFTAIDPRNRIYQKR